jgi:tetratricopeptide (TPR) repeat protein
LAHIGSALRLYRELLRPRDEVNVHIGLVRLASRRGQLATAQQHLLQAEGIANEIKIDPNLEIALLMAKASIQAARGDLDLAGDTLTEILGLAEASRLAFDLTTAQIQLAQVLAQRGDMEQARSYATQALSVSRRRDFRGRAKEAGALLSTLDSAGHASDLAEASSDWRTV